MTGTELGPRRTALLTTWREFAETTATGTYHDFGPDNRHRKVERRLDAFLDSPTEETFEVLWSSETLRDAVIGGPGLVLTTWPGTLVDLANRFEAMRAADEFDPAWEDGIVTRTAIWELYGQLEPTTRPILSSPVLAGLEALGFDKPSGYRDREGYRAFADAYDSIVGHATAGTDHEVPWHFEVGQFLAMVGSSSRSEVLQELPVDREYPRLVGWQAEGHAGRIVFEGVEPLLDKYVETLLGNGFGEHDSDRWGGNYWESWKWTHARHVRENVRSNFEVTDLAAADVEPFLERFKTAPSVDLSNPVPPYLIGGRSGGILWNEFKRRSTEHPSEAAAVLSTLFDEDQFLNDRLAEFSRFYAPLDTSGGPLLSLATVLLMMTYPERYVMYKYGKFETFFSAYSDYELSTGFDTNQYWVLNEACRRLVRVLDEMFADDPRTEREASMLDVHTLIWVAPGAEGL